MKSAFKNSSYFFIALLLLICAFARVDRIFFKRNSSFCIRFLFTSLPNSEEYTLLSPTKTALERLDAILEQPFHYLGKGCHCYAFVSQDQKHVIKFHRYASHMRLFPWLNHPFSYQFDKKRLQIKAHNFEKLKSNLMSYKNSYQDLKEETGLEWVHINRTNHLRRFVTLQDKTGAHYRIPLDEMTFLLQERAELIYPTLDRLYAAKQLEEGKAVVSSIIELMLNCCKKGYVDEDPVLRKNYGLVNLRAIHIDVGDLVKREGIEKRENYIPHIKEMTESLRKRLASDYPELLDHYYGEISKL